MNKKVEVITRLEDLAPLQEGWEMLRRESGTSIFTSHLWTHIWLKHFGDVFDQRVLAFWKGEELVGLAPFALQRSRLMGYPATYLGMIGNMGETSEYHDLGFPFRGAIKEAAEELVGGMRRLRWNLLQLRELRWNGMAQALFHEACAEWQCESMVSKPCPYVSLDPSRDVLEQFEARSGRRVRRIIDSLEKEGRIDFQAVRRKDMVAQSVDIYIQQHKERWAKKGGSIFHEPRQAEFLKEVTAKGAEMEELVIYEVHIDGKVASQQLCIMDGEVIRMYKIGMDDQFRSYAPGYLSVQYAMAEAQNDGFKEFDLGPGPDEYKYKVGGRDRFTYNIQGKRGSMIMMAKAAKLPLIRGMAGKVTGAPKEGAPRESEQKGKEGE